MFSQSILWSIQSPKVQDLALILVQWLMFAVRVDFILQLKDDSAGRNDKKKR